MTIKENHDEKNDFYDEDLEITEAKVDTEDSDEDSEDDCEQVDEVSKKLVSKYMDRATDSLSSLGKSAGGFRAAANRSHSDAEKNVIPAIKSKHLKDFEASKDSADYYDKRSEDRVAGIKLAKDKLTGAAKVPAKNPVGRPKKIANESATEYRLAVESITANDIDVTEDVKSIFMNENVSDDFIGKASRIYEASVLAKVNDVLTEQVAKLEEEYNLAIDEIAEDLTEAYDEKVTEMVEAIDRYLDKVITEWKEENEVALRQTAQAQISESFMSKLKDLFLEHYIEIPEDQVNIVENQIDTIDELTEELNKEVETNLNLSEELVSAYKNIAILESSIGLTEPQRIKLLSLAEGLEYVDDNDFRSKVDELKEHYFKKITTGLVKESVGEILNESKNTVDIPKIESDSDQIMNKYFK